MITNMPPGMGQIMTYNDHATPETVLGNFNNAQFTALDGDFNILPKNMKERLNTVQTDGPDGTN